MKQEEDHLFGRVYTGAVVLPKDNSFCHEEMKDSKKFTSEKKIQELAEYIKHKCNSVECNMGR